MSDPQPPEFPGPLDPPKITVPNPPPLVGEGSPWAPADSENRDRILDWWRAWWRRVFFPWLAAFLAWLYAWMLVAQDYIIKHAVAGYSWRVTVDLITPSATTVVEIEPVDQYHPLRVGDLVQDESDAVNYGIVTSVVDATHAAVEWLGSLAGLDGNSWWSTTDAITTSGTTNVTLPEQPERLPQVGDFVSDQSPTINYGQVIGALDATHVTVQYLGQLRGTPGISWRVTTTAIAHSGTTDVEVAADSEHPLQMGDLIVDTSTDAAWGDVTAVLDATHATVLYRGTLGPGGGGGGGIDSIVAGRGFRIDIADPANPVIDVTSTTGFPLPYVSAFPGSPQEGDMLYRDSLHRPLWWNGTAWKRVGDVQAITAGAHVGVDSTDPNFPVVSVDDDWLPLPIDPNLEVVNLVDRFGIVRTLTQRGIEILDEALFLRQRSVSITANMSNDPTIGSGSIQIGPDDGNAGGYIQMDKQRIVIRFVKLGQEGAPAALVIDEYGLRWDASAPNKGALYAPPFIDNGNARTPTAGGAIIWNSTLNKLQVFNGTGWLNIATE